jgi:hypothetical protein
METKNWCKNNNLLQVKTCPGTYRIMVGLTYWRKKKEGAAKNSPTAVTD